MSWNPLACWVCKRTNLKLVDGCIAERVVQVKLCDRCEVNSYPISAHELAVAGLQVSKAHFAYPGSAPTFGVVYRCSTVVVNPELLIQMGANREFMLNYAPQLVAKHEQQGILLIRWESRNRGAKDWG